jgi:hypothetical protein
VISHKRSCGPAFRPRAVPIRHKREPEASGKAR